MFPVMYSYRDQECFSLLPRSRMFVLLEKEENEIRSNVLCRSQACEVTEFLGALEVLD